MADLAVLGSRNGFDVVRPFPPWLERGHADVTGAQVNQVDMTVPGERANLIGSIEPLRFRLPHRFTPSPLFPPIPRQLSSFSTDVWACRFTIRLSPVPTDGDDGGLLAAAFAQSATQLPRLARLSDVRGAVGRRGDACNEAQSFVSK